MGRKTGLEPATRRSTICCSNQLSYFRHLDVEKGRVPKGTGNASASLTPPLFHSFPPAPNAPALVRSLALLLLPARQTRLSRARGKCRQHQAERETQTTCHIGKVLRRRNTFDSKGNHNMPVPISPFSFVWVVVMGGSQGVWRATIRAKFECSVIGDTESPIVGDAARRRVFQIAADDPQQVFNLLPDRLVRLQPPVSNPLFQAHDPSPPRKSWGQPESQSPDAPFPAHAWRMPTASSRAG